MQEVISQVMQLAIYSRSISGLTGSLKAAKLNLRQLFGKRHTNDVVPGIDVQSFTSNATG